MLQRVDDAGRRMNAEHLVALERLVIDQDEAVDGQVESLADGLKCCRFGTPADLWIEKVIEYSKLGQLLQGRRRFVLAGDGLQDASAIKLFDDGLDAGPE